jgi:HSP20 family molecular chaperone IbpA
MKLKLTLSTLALALVATFQVYILSKIPQSQAVGSFNRIRHCSPLSCGSRSIWDDGWNIAAYNRPHRRSVFDHFNQLFYQLQDDYELERERELTRFARTKRPNYTMRENDEQMELLLEIPGIQASDIKVQLEQGGKLLRVNGTRRTKHQGVEGSTTFERMFTVDPKSVNVHELKASVENGILAISVPKLPKEVEVENRVIPISFKNEEAVKENNEIVVEKAEDVTTDKKVAEDLEITEEEDI